MNLFETATRSKVRFPSNKGNLSIEQLWDVPLRSKGGFDLNAIAQVLNRQLKAVAEENFVDATENPQMAGLQLAFDLVKHIILAKKAEETATKNAAAKRVEKQKLLRILAQKKDGELEGLTVEQLEARIAAL